MGSEVFGERRNILPPFAKRWHVQAKAVYAVKEVLPESSRLCFPIQVQVCGADDSRIDAPFRLISDTRKRTILQKLQELALKIWIQFRNLIQEQAYRDAPIPLSRVWKRLLR